LPRFQQEIPNASTQLKGKPKNMNNWRNAMNDKKPPVKRVIKRKPQDKLTIKVNCLNDVKQLADKHKGKDDELVRSWERISPSFVKRMKCIEKLREIGIWVVPTFSPLGIWKDLQGTLRQLKDLGIPYITTLFFKEGTRSANTPKVFLEYLRKHHPEVLNSQWQNEMLGMMKEVFGKDGVLVGKEGFESLVAPHEVRF
jgi:hypothetical protein